MNSTTRIVVLLVRSEEINMYCSNCGGEIIENLSYCNHCGRKMTGANKLSEASFNTLVAGILAMPIAGVGVLIGLISVMKETLGFGNDVIIVIHSN